MLPSFQRLSGESSSCEGILKPEVYLGQSQHYLHFALVQDTDIVDHLPVHNSQAGDTTITTDTTYPIPSLPSLPPPPSFPSPPPFSAYDHLDPPHDPFLEDGVLQSGLGGRAMEDDLVMSDEMLQEFLRSPSPDLMPPALGGLSTRGESQAVQSPQSAMPLGRAVSPFVPPTQAILPSQLEASITQSASLSGSGGRTNSQKAATSANGSYMDEEPPASLSITTPARSRPGPATQPDTSPESVEIGRSANAPHEPMASQTMYHNVALTPQTPVNASSAPQNSARSSFTRQDTAPGLPITFGSAITQDSPAPVSSQAREKSGHKARLSLGGFGTPVNKGSGGPRSSVGFTFGSRLASPSGKR